MVRRILFVTRRAPHGSHYAKEQLQMAMVFGAFEQQVSMLFMDDGVFALCDGQNPDAIGFENFSMIYASLEKFYDIDQIYVDEASLVKRELSQDRLVIAVQSLNNIELIKLMHEQDFILSG